MVSNSSNFPSAENVFILLLFLKDISLAIEFEVDNSFLSALECYLTTLASMIFDEKSLVIQTVVSLYVICHLSLTAICIIYICVYIYR